LGTTVQAMTAASTLPELAAELARAVRELLGHEHAVVYEIPDAGPGCVLAEARAPHRPSWLGRQLAALDLAPTWRSRLLHHRVHLTASTGAEPVELVPHEHFGPEGMLDLSGSALASLPAWQRQQMAALGVVSAVLLAIARDGRLWGLVAAVHGQPLPVRPGLRVAIELLAEVMSTRMAAIESYARVRVEAQVRRLEERLLHATARQGDWCSALFQDPATLLAPLKATGAVLFHGDWLRASGQVPPAHALNPLARWLDSQAVHGPWHCQSIERQDPGLDGLSPWAGGVLSVRLSAAPGHHLVWLRRSAAAEAADASAPAWDSDDIALATAFGRALVDLIAQTNAVRLVIAASQVSEVRASVAAAREPVVVLADGATGDAAEGCFANDAFFALAGRRRADGLAADTLAGLFSNPRLAHQVMGQVRAEHRAWQGELTLRRPDGTEVPVAVRARPVPARHERLLGMVFIFNDLRDSKAVDAARMQLERALSRTSRAAQDPAALSLLGAIVANASLAAMDIADAGNASQAAPLLRQVEASTARAAALFDCIRGLDERPSA
jgi:hypothetical protein